MLCEDHDGHENPPAMIENPSLLEGERNDNACYRVNSSDPVMFPLSTSDLAAQRQDAFESRSCSESKTARIENPRQVGGGAKRRCLRRSELQ